MSKISHILLLCAFIALFLDASSVSARDFSLQHRVPILTSSSINGFKTSLGNFSGAKINPSSITLTIGGKDVTSVTDITVSRGASYGEVYDGFNFEVKLTDPLKAQPNLEIKLSGTTKDGIPFETKTVAGVVAKIGIDTGEAGLTLDSSLIFCDMLSCTIFSTSRFSNQSVPAVNLSIPESISLQFTSLKSRVTTAFSRMRPSKPQSVFSSTVR
jgi:hypothetical protein